MIVYLLGAANPETIRMIRAIQRSTANIEFALLDNDATKHEKPFYGFPVLGGLEKVATLKGPSAAFVNLITGSTQVRYETTRVIVSEGGVLSNFIHPSVDLTMTHIGLGNYIQEGVILQAEVSIGDNSSIHIGSLIGHETRIGDSVFIAHGVSVSGCCTIGDGTFIGTHATILPRVNIGKWVTIGAGAVVTKDVPDYSVVVGSPARIIRTQSPVYDNGRVLQSMATGRSHQ
ncbi:NeuD/PglB/VioB family sugar acetyltransferase [Pseudomonas sp. RC10]|uniref:NeuD/PglB/VioB family sugar acetyltransferase n=1 Tax=Pseudomonas bambusae TaxID=3139142 RepID=UPI00313946EB